MSAKNTIIYVASAGTGKTTTLTELLSDCLDKTTPDKICFTTFTKAAATEAIGRCLDMYPKYTEKDFSAFSTLHALCYRRIPKKQMLNLQDYKLIGELTGYKMSGISTLYDHIDEATTYTAKGDKLLQYNSLMRTMKQSASQALAGQLNTNFTAQELDDFSIFYKTYKEKQNKYDFTDQLETFLKLKIKLGVEYLFVDEAQDLSPLQWDIVNLISDEVKQVYIAGDDKQSIYKFSGGSPTSLINKKGKRIVLDTSYRLPKNVLEYSEQIANQIQEKQEYSIKCHQDRECGQVHRIRSIEDLDLSKGSWFFLCRNKVMMSIFETVLLKKNYIFISGRKDSLFNERQIFFIKLWEKLRLGYKFKASLLKELYRNYLPTGSVVARGSKNLLDSMPDTNLYDKQDLVNDFGLKTLAKWDIVFRLSDLAKQRLINAEQRNVFDRITDIEVNTIHASKGREADNVVVLPDMTSASYDTYKKDPDNEHRVFYVAVTRAKQNLYLHQPVTNRFYKLV
jgi:superfamily I DNA/RNA helicase